MARPTRFVDCCRAAAGEIVEAAPGSNVRLADVQRFLADKAFSPKLGFSAKDNCFIIKRPYYYRQGMTAEKFAKHLTDTIPTAKVLTKGDKNVRWPGQSYFFVKFQVPRLPKSQPELSVQPQIDAMRAKDEKSKFLDRTFS